MRSLEVAGLPDHARPISPFRQPDRSPPPPASARLLLPLPPYHPPRARRRDAAHDRNGSDSRGRDAASGRRAGSARERRLTVKPPCHVARSGAGARRRGRHERRHQLAGAAERVPPESRRGVAGGRRPDARNHAPKATDGAELRIIGVTYEAPTSRTRSGCRVGGAVARPTPHGAGRAELPHPALRSTGSLREAVRVNAGRAWAAGIASGVVRTEPSACDGSGCGG